MSISGTAYVFLVALVAAAGGFLFGFDLSIASGALPFLKEQFGLDAAGEGLAMSSAIFGSIAGPLAGMWLADRVGRRSTRRSRCSSPAPRPRRRGRTAP